MVSWLLLALLASASWWLFGVLMLLALMGLSVGARGSSGAVGVVDTGPCCWLVLLTDDGRSGSWSLGDGRCW
jgi:hypothetical protein